MQGTGKVPAPWPCEIIAQAFLFIDLKSIWLRKMARTLGTSLLALMLSVASAPTSQAEVIFAAPGPATLEGEGGASDRFAVDGVEIACDEATYRGESSGNSKTLALEPEYAECVAKALSGFPADFFQELCDFVLHDLERATKGWRAEVDLSCAPGWIGIGWDLFETEAAYQAVRSTCFMRVAEQTDIGTAELRNLRDGNGIEVRWDLHEFEYTIGGSRSFGSSLLCGSTLDRVRGDTRYSGVAKVFAKDPAGASVALSIRG